MILMAIWLAEKGSVPQRTTHDNIEPPAERQAIARCNILPFEECIGSKMASETFYRCRYCKSEDEERGVYLGGGLQTLRQDRHVLF